MKCHLLHPALAGVVLLLSTIALGYPSKDRSSPRPKGTRTDIVPSHFPETYPRATAGGPAPTAWGVEVRRIDGWGNNVANPEWGALGCNLIRLSPPAYADGMSQLAGPDRPNPRDISNIVVAQSNSRLNSTPLTDFLWQWGQFLDHDLDLSPVLIEETADIPVPMGDPMFDPGSTGTQYLPFERSAYDVATGTGPGNPRQQFNILTGYIDASNVYGSDDARAAWLRTMSGGRLKTSPGDFMPYNTDGLENAGGNSPTMFVAGDVRANEQIGLTTMHTLFVREHNWWAERISNEEPGLTDEEIYQRARAIVGAVMQVITYKEFLPRLLGPDALPPYTGYNPAVDASVAAEFSTACYRLGHTLLSPMIRRVAANGEPIPEGDVALRDAFFQPNRLPDEGGIDPILRGLASQVTQHLDQLVIDDVRNFLFGPPGSGGMDLPSLNIQRARDHGVASYAAVRLAVGLGPVSTFADITSDAEAASRLQAAYGDVNKVDLWVGALSEDHLPGAQVGELLFTVVGDQFRRSRDGDRFWYQNFFSGPLLEELENTRLSHIIRRNTGIGDELKEDVFVYSQGAVPAASTWSLLCIACLLLIAGTLTVPRKHLRFPS